MTAPIFTDFRPEHARLWGQHPVMLQHRLHESPLFSDDALAALLHGYPRPDYDLLCMAPQGTGHLQEWREGDLGRAEGRAALEAIQRGRMWINLRHLHQHSEPHAALLDEIFREIEARVPGLRTFKHNLGLLISSPGAQVYYHADLPGQSLWQLRGQKRVYVYPNTPPFLPEDQLEGIVLNLTEAEIAYEPWFDQHARVYELQPGQMLHWPLNCPHRVENHDVVNVSLTTEHWTATYRRAYAERYTNGLLRTRIGVQPDAPRLGGARFWAKAAVAAAVKQSGLMRKHKHPKRIEWELDPAAPTGRREIEPWVL
jgi:hypothetical protein